MSTILKVENLSKQYRLGVIGTGTLSHDLNRWWHKIRGKEDPYLKIGEINDRAVKGKSDYVWALKDIDFEVEEGEALGIIGKNGAGKSTLLKILSRVTTPSKGKILADGRIASLLEVGTGFHPELTGKENIYLNGAILGMTKKEVNSKLDEIIDFAGVERYIDTPVKRYSSGMYVRLAFAVAAHLEPDILIVDEVLAVGDLSFQKKCLGKMQDISSKGRTVLFVSHNMGLIRSLCSRVIWLENGKIKQNGESIEVVNNYTLSFKDKLSSVGFNENTEINNSAIRRGSKDARFSSIKFYNEKGESTDVFGVQENVLLEFQIKVFEDIQNMNFSFLIFSPYSGEVITSISAVKICVGAKKDQIYTCKFLIEQPNLRTGEYPLYLWLGDNANYYYDVIDKLFYLNIVSSEDESVLGYNPNHKGRGFLDIKTTLDVA